MESLFALDQRLQYPIARRDESVVDYYHGVWISDPYQWLEDPHSEETKEFVQKQDELCKSVLKKCNTRKQICDKVTELFHQHSDHQYYCPLDKQGNNYFYHHSSGLQVPRVTNVQVNLDGKPEVLRHPIALSEDETVSWNKMSVSKGGRYQAYGCSSSGSDWVTIKVTRIEVKNEILEPDTLQWVKFSSINWTHDNKGFFYSRYPAPKGGGNIDAGTETSANLSQELYYHFLGTDQSEDILCWKDSENPNFRFQSSITEDGKYLLLYILESCDPVNKVYYFDLSVLHEALEGCRGKDNLLRFVKLIDQFDALYTAIANDDTLFTFRTNKGAPRYKLVRVDLKQPNNWTDVIPESEKDVLESADAVNRNKMIVRYLSNVRYVLQIRDLEAGSFLYQLQLPLGIGTVHQITAKREDARFFIQFSSFLTPCITYQYDLGAEVPHMLTQSDSVPGFDRTEFDFHQVFVPRKDGTKIDGTKIPMFIMGKKNVDLDGPRPCLLQGYGGFNSSSTPSFDRSHIVLARHLGAFICIANIRGGGEYGEEWHKAGSLSKKQNAFDDFISAAEYLISAGYTHPSKLCIEGWSNGGLLIGACINQRPELFGCALAHVGVMDMLRFHRFTIGHAWTSEYGCSGNKEEFHCLRKYSPLHNVRRPWKQPAKVPQYPATMLLTADHDDRVVPLHSLKFLVTMQHVLCTSLENSPQTNPIIGRIERNAGHVAGRSREKQIDEAADRYAFMAMALNATWNK
ncbi:hypothetical protein SLE2022_173240 [Rubroshorea leprosula]